jgi:hypothetical protein
MTQWGMLLLCVYITLGVSGRASWRKAGRIAMAVTVIVIGIVMVTYSSRTPVDKYIRSVDATVYATGNQYPGASTTTTGIGTGQPASSTENTTGVVAATYSNTDHSTVANGSSGGGS